MIYIKEDVNNKMKEWKVSSICVVTDFDRTITSGDSDSSWGVISKSNLIPNEYLKDRTDLYNYYRPIEIDENIDYIEKNKLMIEWWNKHIELFKKYKFTKEVIEEVANNSKAMTLRRGSKEFLKQLYEKNIPVIIISAGIGNFIESFLKKNNCYYENITIVSNFIKFENKIAVGMVGDVIHSLNKDEVLISDEIKNIIQNRKNIVLLGDSISDIKMINKELRNDALKIGFLEEKIDENMEHYKNNFDVVCTDNTSYDELTSKILFLVSK